ncbi:hypothetical protein [Bacillus sp. D386]|uniref:hypothetical protein n=1 Tax=Bacillus sp. D386 TaxID=2587155 RepID=UPI0011243B8B|nr:hypothetical protein [Bacillus sp. D386]
MKRFSLLFTFLFVFISIFSACSTNTRLELVSAEAEIVNDKNKTGSTILQEGENAGKEVVPTALYYTFVIKNVGNKKIGDISKGVGLEARIEPDEKLVTASNEVMGFNIFEPADYEGSGLGFGYSYTAIIEEKETGEFTIYYDLGVEEKTEEVLPVPSVDKLEHLKDNALEATLIVSLGKEEIIRFDLSKKN